MTNTVYIYTYKVNYKILTNTNDIYEFVCVYILHVLDVYIYK